MHELIGLRVMHRTTKRRGRIKNIIDRKMVVSFAEGEAAYPFPAVSYTHLMDNMKWAIMKWNRDREFVEKYKNDEGIKVKIGAIQKQRR